MRFILIALLALWPAVVFADMSYGDTKDKPSSDNPCIEEKGNVKDLDQGLSLTNLLIMSSLNAVATEPSKEPCPTDKKATEGTKEKDRKNYDPWEDNPYLRLFPN